LAFLVTDVVQRASDTWRTLYALPKVDLHRHLEGSIRLETLWEVAQRYGVDVPAATPEGLRPFVQVTHADPADMSAFIDKFGILRRFFLDPEVIQRVVCEVIEDAAADNIRYLELRFTPNALAKARGFRLDEVVGWVCDSAKAAASANRIKVNLIVSMNRHEGLDIAKETLHAALQYQHSGVVGLDLAGKEPGFPARPFSQLFRHAKQAGLGLTLHAGEWAGAENVRDAIENIRADRIGHGVRIVEDSATVQLARERGVFFEVCPTSNVQTGIVGLLQHHPMLDMRFLELPMTINTDDPAVSQTTLTDEYALAMVGMGLSLRDIHELISNSVRAAFLPEDEKHDLLLSLRRELGTTKYRGLDN